MESDRLRPEASFKRQSDLLPNETRFVSSKIRYLKCSFEHKSRKPKRVYKRMAIIKAAKKSSKE